MWGGSGVHSDAPAWHIGPAAPLWGCPCSAAGDTGLPLASAVAQQGPSGCWGVCKGWQDRTLGFCEFTLKLLLKNQEGNVRVPRVLPLLHLFIW